MSQRMRHTTSFTTSHHTHNTSRPSNDSEQLERVDPSPVVDVFATPPLISYDNCKTGSMYTVLYYDD